MGKNSLVMSLSLRMAAMLLIDSKAFSLTVPSSCALKASSGGNKHAAYWAPPTYSVNLPSSSAKARKNSSSSSTDSFKKGTNSLRVRSTPRALAIVDNLCTAFKRRETSSCFSSSIRTATG
eukprot:Lithocolla_globosa_v1_NODE_1488_length_2538_cov_88.993556.p2 type:complete len:121 gc:universal NODE_1488_length_2538_cov_88.993556:1078-716(-)